MSSNDLNIERWLEEDLSDEENIPNEECSDLDCDVDLNHVLEESYGSDSKYEETAERENSLCQNSLSSIPTDDEPLSQMRLRPRK
ncbi:unnamed protein product [Parnassius apollo]|uniref:(apollo) hypothetical protein n=1 Tax=Parnassius apollo TaxID=110799 RepID=A0A8S3XGF7_PARAO|nr:unnamed protein product [Parnassius apollo]